MIDRNDDDPPPAFILVLRKKVAAAVVAAFKVRTGEEAEVAILDAVREAAEEAVDDLRHAADYARFAQADEDDRRPGQ